MPDETRKVLLFVCEHGAGKSRIAAAWFNAAAIPAWHAVSGAVDPQESLGTNAPRLLADTLAEPFLDTEAPRRASDVTSAGRTIAIDCAVDGAEAWTLHQSGFTEALHDEIRALVETLISELVGEASYLPLDSDRGSI